MGSSGGKDAEGTVGLTGPRGERGENGFTIHSGEGIPSSGLGVNEDYYVDKSSHLVYGPKTGGAWGSGTNLIGERGEKGLTGAEGQKGVTGAKGEVGAAGSQGIEGSKGSTGGTGVAGSSGEKGATGSAGATGERGEKGEKGSQGVEGAKGSTGSGGSTGPEGAKGEKGEIGAKGSTGSKGETGTEGPKGSTGETGPKGTTGSVGPSASLGEWKNLSLETGITNKGEPYSNIQCSKDSLGLVYLRGVAKSSGLVAKEGTLATLPSGYEPAKQQSVTANLGGTVGNLLILTNGKIQVSIGVGLETTFSFDSIFFPLV